MARLRKFLALPAADRLLFLKALALLGGATAMLRLLPFPLVRRLLLEREVAVRRAPAADVMKRVVWSVRSASRFVPAATCLPQALVTQLLLKRRGHPATLRIGVAMNAQQQLVAHAWVESEGRIVIGGTDSYRRYSALPPLEEERA